mgnify:FL=1
MKEYKITDYKKACLLLVIFFWGLLTYFDFGAPILVKLFPLEWLVKYIDPIFYGSFFLLMVIVFRKALWKDIKDFVINFEKYLDRVVIFGFIALVLMVASAIYLDSVGIGDSSNQQALDEAVIRYGALHIITIAVIGPIVEEIFYRGIFFGFLKGRGKSIVRSIAAILLSSMIFAFSHTSIIDFCVTDLLANIPVFMLGLVATTLYWRTDNLICPVIVHIIINTIGTLG